MAGPKNEKNDLQSAVQDFFGDDFGDDDLWDEEEEGEESPDLAADAATTEAEPLADPVAQGPVPTPEPAPAPAAEPEPDASPAALFSAEIGRVVAVQPPREDDFIDAVHDEPTADTVTVITPEMLAEARAVAAGAPVPAAPPVAAAPPAPVSPAAPTPVAPPPPPPFTRGGRTVPTAGPSFSLDDLAPRLDPPLPSAVPTMLDTSELPVDRVSAPAEDVSAPAEDVSASAEGLSASAEGLSPMAATDAVDVTDDEPTENTEDRLAEGFFAEVGTDAPPAALGGGPGLAVLPAAALQASDAARPDPVLVAEGSLPVEDDAERLGAPAAAPLPTPEGGFVRSSLPAHDPLDEVDDTRFDPRNAPLAPMEDRTFSNAAEGWSHALQLALAESAGLAGVEKGQTLADAAHVALRRLGDPERAGMLLTEAVASGYLSEASARDRRVVLKDSPLEARLQAMEEEAALHTGAARADVLRAAAQQAAIASDTAAAARLHREAVEADPEDLGSWRALRDAAVASKDAEGRVIALQRLGELVDPALAADHHRERAATLHRLGRTAEAIPVFETARAAAHDAGDHGDDGQIVRAMESVLAEVGDYDRQHQLYVSCAEAAQARALTKEGSEDTEEVVPEASFWWRKAARAARAAGRPAESAAAYEKASLDHDVDVAAEVAGWRAAQGRGDELAEALTRRAGVVESTGASAEAAALWFRAGVHHEWLVGNRDAALEAYRSAARHEGLVAAREAVVRLLATRGAREQRTYWQLQADVVDAPSERVFVLLRCAEALEGEDAASEDTAAAWRALTEAAPDFALGWAGRARAGLARGERDEVSLSHHALSALCLDPVARADHAVLAAMGWEHLHPAPEDDAPDADGDDAVGEAVLEALSTAWAAAPGHRVALHLHLAQVASADDAAAQRAHAWMAHADALAADADATGSAIHVGQAQYLAARGALATGDSEQAAKLAQAASTCSCEHTAYAASRLARALTDSASVQASYAAAVRDAEDAEPGTEAASWRAFAALALDEVLPGGGARIDAVQGDVLAWAGVREIVLTRAWRTGDVDRQLETGRQVVEHVSASSLVDLADRHIGRDAYAVRDLLHDLTQREDTPVRCATHVALAAGAWEEAAELLAKDPSPAARLDEGLLRCRRGIEPERGVATLSALSIQADVPQPLRLRAAESAARYAAIAGDNPTMTQAMATAAVLSKAPALVALNQVYAARGLTREGDHQAAGKAWLAALAARPGSLEAFEGARAALITLGATERLDDLYISHRADDLRGRAEAIEDAGDATAAAAAWLECAETHHRLVDRLAHEQVLCDAEDWSAYYEALTQRLTETTDPTEANRIEGRRRWVLADKLADTDEAWVLYEGLLEADPGDREVLEAVARIAGARGETDKALGYLADLASGAESASERARYHRRIAEVHLHAGGTVAARRAYHDALEAMPDDLEALRGIRALAEDQGDWSSVLEVMQREVSLKQGEDRIEALRQVARLTDEHVADGSRENDAWQAVLAAVPSDVEALQRLVGLAEQRQDWDALLEYGASLAAASAPDRAGILRRMGEVSMELGRREDAMHHLEQAAGAEDPDAEAAGMLASLYRERNDWAGVVRALAVQGAVLEDPADRVVKLLEAAQIELDVRHDREAAARFMAGVLELDPDNLVAMRFQARHYYDAGRYPEAIPIFERLAPRLGTEDDLDDFDVRMEAASFYYRFAQMLRSADEGAAALERYESALELNPNHLHSLEAVGPLYAAKGDWKRAEVVYRQLLQLTGGDGEPKKVAETYTMLGLVEQQLGRADKAQKRFNKALEKYPNYVPALKGLARHHEALEDWNAVLTSYNAVIWNATVTEDILAAYMTKARILDDKLGRPEKAVQHYERSLSFYAHQPGALLRLTELALRRADWDEALSLAGRAMSVADSSGPLLADMHVAKALAYAHLGDEAQARQELDHAAVAAPELVSALGPDPLADLALAHEGLKQRLPQ